MSDEKYKINNELWPLFESFTEYFKEFSKDLLSNDDLNKMFDLVLKATVIKSFEFTLLCINSKSDDIFFMTPALRGICEEYIVERFLWDKYEDADERNSLILMWQQYGILKSSISQWSYFTINKPDQRLYYDESFSNKLKQAKEDIKRHFKRQFPKSNFKSTFPSIYFMAKETGLTEMYQYLYHSASTFVHFNPQNLFRMSWGNNPHMTFSTAHFKYYYNDFIIYYGAMLFCELSEWQASIGKLSDFDTDTIATIRKVIKGVSRWPELVTFEEMNIGVLSRNLFYKSPGMQGDEGSFLG